MGQARLIRRFQQAGPQCTMHLEHGVRHQLGNLLDLLSRLLHSLFPSRSSHLRGDQLLEMLGQLLKLSPDGPPSEFVTRQAREAFEIPELRVSGKAAARTGERSGAVTTRLPPVGSERPCLCARSSPDRMPNRPRAPHFARYPTIERLGGANRVVRPGRAAGRKVACQIPGFGYLGSLACGGLSIREDNPCCAA
jgi:hypothetical protein